MNSLRSRIVNFRKSGRLGDATNGLGAVWICSEVSIRTYGIESSDRRRCGMSDRVSDHENQAAKSRMK